MNSHHEDTNFFVALSEAKGLALAIKTDGIEARCFATLSMTNKRATSVVER